MARSQSWVKIPEEAAIRALYPAVTHVEIAGTLKRLDSLTLDEARTVIRRLADERERLVEAHNKEADQLSRAWREEVELRLGKLPSAL